MRKIIILIVCILTYSCQVKDDSGELWVSDRTPKISHDGGILQVKTAGAAQCSIIENNNYESIVNINLMDKTSILHEGEWYSFKSDQRGLNILITFKANNTTSARNLNITLIDADLYSKIEILQE